MDNVLFSKRLFFCFVVMFLVVGICDLVIGFIFVVRCILFMGRYSEDLGCGDCVFSCIC